MKGQIVRFIIFIFIAHTSVSAEFNFWEPFEAIEQFVKDEVTRGLTFFGLIPSITVDTTKGQVQGKLAITADKRVKYSRFQGIPYAKPPVGYLRFKPPQELDAWEGLYKAEKQKDACTQMIPAVYIVIGKEDCLYLNVYTPKIEQTDMKKRAVMVWIYGGSFVFGSSSPLIYGPDFLIEEDVVVVVMNYRVGALGFLALNHENATGNAGLKDQNMALKWVQQNIINFGGDPEKVTVFGQSAGSVSTMFQILSEASNGLFRSAIAMSGSPLNRWGFILQSEAVSRSFNIGRKLGVDTTDESILLQKLYDVPAKKIAKVVDKIFNSYFAYVMPTIEDPKAESPFLTQCSIDKLKTGNFNQVPLMMGLTNRETLLYLTKRDMAQAGIDDCLESIKNVSELQNTEEVKFLREAQTRNRNSEAFTDEERNKIVNVTSAITFHSGIDRTHQLLVSKVPVYYYRNSFDYPESLHRRVFINLEGTGHADDVLHVFWSPLLLQPLDPNSDIGIHRTKMVKMWTNFAKYGNPTPDGDSDPLLKINWPVSDSEATYLEINKNFTVGKRPIDEFAKLVQRAMEPILNEINGCQ